MKPLVSIIMGSTSDLPVMEKAFDFLNKMQIPFEVNALSAHRTPDAVAEFAHNAESRGLKVIIAGAGMAAAFMIAPVPPHKEVKAVPAAPGKAGVCRDVCV